MIRVTPKKDPQDFESTLKALEEIVTNLERGDLPLEEALTEFETAIKLVQQGQEKLEKAEQRIQILLNKSENAPLEDYNPTSSRDIPNSYVSKSNDFVDEDDDFPF